MNKIMPHPYLFWLLLGMAIFAPICWVTFALPDFMAQNSSPSGYRILPEKLPTAKTYRLTPDPTTPKNTDAIGNTILQLSIKNQPENRVLRDLAKPESKKRATSKSETSSSSQLQGLLGTKEFYMGNIKALPKWTRVLSGIAKDKPLVDQCDQNKASCQTETLKAWRTFVQSQQGLPLKDILVNLNKYANQFPYITDIDLWGKSDYWATPLEFLKNSGDCEDYVILKYTTLRQLGIPAEKLRLVVVKDTVRNLAHAILAVYDDSDIYILDSLFDAVLSHQQVLQYIPYYSVNENARWAHIKPAN